MVQSFQGLDMAVWIVIGASRGIGLEWVRQLLARGDQVFATVRDHTKASQLWTLSGSAPRASCQLLECDVSSEASIIVRLLCDNDPRPCLMAVRGLSMTSLQ